MSRMQENYKIVDDTIEKSDFHSILPNTKFRQFEEIQKFRILF